MTERSDFPKYFRRRRINIQYSFSLLFIPIHRMEIKMIQDKSADTDAAGWPTLVLRRILKELFTLFLL